MSDIIKETFGICTSRLLRATQLEFEPDETEINMWVVPSQSNKAIKYYVRHSLDCESGKMFWSCTCDDFFFRKGHCKHILAVRVRNMA